MPLPGEPTVLKILLDTHIILWLFHEPERIPVPARRVLADLAHELWISPISIWEILILAHRGRLTLKPDPESWIRASLETAGFREAPLNTEVAIRSRTIALSHEDPADRFLAATAAVFGLTLMTLDRTLRECKEIDLLPLA
jgi:PIN domain nuclease of toxin-antitoxin system